MNQANRSSTIELRRDVPTAVLIVMWLAAATALIVSSYLTAISLLGDSAPLGCGAGSGCGDVLASKWSRWLGLPVSLLAVLIYLLVMAGLVCLRPSSSRPWLGWIVLIKSAAAIVAVAIWFSYLQWFVFGSFCRYCLTAHASGVILAGLIFWRAPIWRVRIRPVDAVDGDPYAEAVVRPADFTRMQTAGLVLAGLIGAAVLIGVQIASKEVVHRRTGLPTGLDFDEGAGHERRIGLLGGSLILQPDQEPLIGSPDAQQIFAMMIDYACPHCRRTHGRIREAQKQSKRTVAIIMLHLPLDKRCNPASTETDPRFKDSCKFSELALAVWIADRAKFDEFDRWLADPRRQPAPAKARRAAEQLIGAEALDDALRNPRIKQMIDRNVKAYTDHKLGRVPITLAPMTAPIVGRIEETNSVTDVLNESFDALSAGR